MPVAAFLPAIISAGGAVGGALIGKSASDNATEAQTDAADQSLALTEKMYEQDRADYAPYRNLGAFSVGELGHLTGMPKDFGTQAVQQATATPATTAAPAPHQSLWDRIVARDHQPAAAESEVTRAAPEFQTLRDLGATQQTASSFVRMRAPNGEEADVPSHEAALFEAQGARRMA